MRTIDKWRRSREKKTVNELENVGGHYNFKLWHVVAKNVDRFFFILSLSLYVDVIVVRQS